MTVPDDFGRGPAEASYRPGPDRPVAALLADLADDLRKLLRLEITLFKLELGEKLGRLGRGLIAVAVAGFLALSGWLALLAAAALGLATVLQPWLAALVVGLAALAAAAILFYFGKRWLNAQKLVPRRTLKTLRGHEAWIKERLP